MPLPNESPQISHKPLSINKSPIKRQSTITKFFTAIVKPSKNKNKFRKRKRKKQEDKNKFTRTEYNSFKNTFFKTINKSHYDATCTWQGYFFTATNNFREFTVKTIIPIVDNKQDYQYESGTKVATASVDDNSVLTHIEVEEKFRRRGIGTALVRFMKRACPKFMVFGGVEENSRYRLTDEGGKLITHCQKKGILAAEDIIVSVSVPASLDF